MWHKFFFPVLKSFFCGTAPGRKRRSLSAALSVVMLMAGAPPGQVKGQSPLTASGNDYPVRQAAQKRVVMLRHSETAEGSRCTITSDSLLDDYSSYVEGERFLVRIPQATLFNRRHNTAGPGFADMRVEQGEDDVVVSFLLQPGASVSVSQSFNRLELTFLTNETATASGRPR
jgi:hypothetical protein